MTRVVEHPRGTPVVGLEEGPLPLWGGPLQDAVAVAAAEAGLELGPYEGGEALVVRTPCALGPGALEAALDAGRGHGRDVAFRLEGETGAWAERVAVETREPGLFYLAVGGTEELAQRLAAAPDVALEPDEKVFPLELPGHTVQLAVSRRLVVPVGHWVELLWANLLGLGPWLWERLLHRNPGVAAAKLGWAALRATSGDPDRVASKVNHIDRTARVHPTATIQGSWLGPKARVGAGAVVRGAVLGEGAKVEELAICDATVLGPGALVERQGMVKYAVLGEGAVVGGVVQLGVVGPGASFKRGAYGLDQALSGAVRVKTSHGLVPAPAGFLGICLGAGAQVGTGVRVAPGRALPAGVTVVADALARPDVTPGTYVLRDGRLHELE